MKITKRQLRRIIREAAVPDIPDIMGAIGHGKFQPRKEMVDTFDKVKDLQPGDKITINGKPSIVVDINTFTARLTYVADGKSTLKDLDYRLAVRYDDDPEDMLPEIEIIYIGKGQVPQKLRQPPRKKGPGHSYSVMD